MKILFVHQNFPGQFKHLAPALVAQGHEVVSLSMQKNLPPIWNGVRSVIYSISKNPSANVHPWVSEIEVKTLRAEAVFHKCLELKSAGFTPDVIIAHPGWGESLFLKNVWPRTKLGIYCEFFYYAHGVDVGFDPEFPVDGEDYSCRLQMKNMNNLLHFEIADAGLSPTEWQASLFPENFRSKISVIHEGINTQVLVPNPNATITLNNQLTLTCKDEIITFVNRNLEPYRGYHIFMRTLPDLLARRPNARILIIGGDNVSYGARAMAGQTWKAIFFNEVKQRFSPADLARIHFLGQVSYPHFISILQLSTVHVYLTYPFVLSWSVFEAMSSCCAIVASNTQPLHGVIQHNETGKLVNFFDQAAWVTQISELLDAPEERERLGKNAREMILKNYDLETVCLPKQLQWVKSLLEK